MDLMTSWAQALSGVHYLPIGTTLISAAFLAVLLTRAARRGWPPHLLWWAAGVAAYGAGTAVESIITLRGNTAELTRWWYVLGAILGGYPLATGSVYLLLPRRTAHLLTAVSFACVVAAGVLVVLSPINESLLQPHRPSGKVLEWTWVRALTPFINGYAALFLIGGAAYSAFEYFAAGQHPWRAAGNVFITVGALLPGIGGAMAKADIVEMLYIGEFLGIVLIWIGAAMCMRAPAPTPAVAPVPVSA